MNLDDIQIDIRCDRPDDIYRPAESISGYFVVRKRGADEIRAVEISVMWYTDGKGDEDMAVHYFHRYSHATGEDLDSQRPFRFQATLPNSPLSYHGFLFKIRWCVRVRVFSDNGKQCAAEKLFQLVASLPEQNPS